MWLHVDLLLHFLLCTYCIADFDSTTGLSSDLVDGECDCVSLMLKFLLLLSNLYGTDGDVSVFL